MPHVRPEDIFVVCGDGYAIRSASQASYEVAALCSIGEAGEDAALGCVPIVGGPLVKDEEVGLCHREDFVRSLIEGIAVVNTGGS